MCSTNQYKTQQPLHQKHILPISTLYNFSFQTAQKIYEAMTDSELPEVSSFVLIIDTITRKLNNEFGIGGQYGPWTPLSAITLDNNYLRFRTKEMQVIHDGYIAFNMSHRNREMVNQVLGNELSLQAVSSHSCGLYIVDKINVNKLLESELYKSRNLIRSRANSLGTELFLSESLDDLPSNVDMGNSEIAAYKRMWKILEAIPQLTSDDKKINKQIIQATNYIYKHLYNSEPVESNLQYVQL